MLRWLKSVKKRVTHFFKEPSFARNMLLGVGVGLAVVGSTVATVATLGAASPALGISLGGLVAFSGSIGITVAIGAGIVAATSFITGALGAFISKISPARYEPIVKNEPIINEQNQTVDNLSRLYLGDLPRELYEVEILPQLAVRDLSRLAITCHSLYQLFSKPLLLAQAAYGVIENPNKENKQKAIAMLNANPTLVTDKIKQVKDKVGRIILNKTIFQLAYGAGDDDYCLAMKPAFIKHCGSEEAAIKEMARQRDEMLDSEEEYKKKGNCSPLNTINY